MERAFVLLFLAFIINFIQMMGIETFVPFFFKYGITIFTDTLDMDVYSFDEKIGRIYEKEDTTIKIISSIECFFVAKSRIPLESRSMPRFINTCCIKNGKYVYNSKIPIAYILFPIIVVIEYFFNKRSVTYDIFSGRTNDFFDTKFLLLISSVYIFGSIYLHNVKFKSMLIDLKEFLSGIEL